MTRAEQLLGVENLYDPRNILLIHHMSQALKAHTLFKRDVDYVVKDGQVIIVDEFTGRLMPGRRWSDGLHQAIEAKENVKIESENQTLATITFQNYFRMYKKLGGMTGTADTESVEFKEIYNLEVSVVPTNQPMIREDNHDVVFKSEAEKFDAVVEEIRDCYERGQPVLVGTVSIEKSERLSNQLKKTGIKFNVLNAKNHEREAEIVAQAGRFKAVTISTNMAGRGTDIVLGGNPEGLAAAEAGTRDPADEKFQQALARDREQCARERTQVLEAGGLHILARSATNRGGSTISCGGDRDARAIRDRRGFTSHSKTTCCGSSGGPAQGIDDPYRDGRRGPDRASMDFQGDRERAEEG